MEKWLSCPFCDGSADGVEQIATNSYYYMKCSKCGAYGPRAITPEWAIKYWNKRMKCYRNGGCGPYELLSCNECPASKPDYNKNYDLHKSLNKKGENKMNNLFNGMFGKIAPGMCRVSMNGEIAIKTSNGYKTYDVANGTLTNCDNFALDVGEDWFFIIPTNKVMPGDIILAGGRPRCVIEVNDNEIKTFCYEDGTIGTIVPERHIFMGKQYFYGKIVSMFGNVMNGKNGMNNMMKYMMMSEMMKGGGNNSTMDFGKMLPMMMFMNGNTNFMNDMFNFDTEDTEVTGKVEA
jgi:hypothetical protein